MPDINPYPAFRFEIRLQVAGSAGFLCEGAFAECSGLEVAMEPKTIREGGNNTRQVHLVGQVTHGLLTLRRGMTSNLDLWRWFASSTSGLARGVKADGLISVRDTDGSDKIRFRLNGCLPVRLRGPSLNARDGAVAIEEMQIAYGALDVEAA